DSVKARHILIKVAKGDTLSKAKMKIRIDSIKAAILKKKNFMEMAKKFSEDAGSKDSGGALGWFTTGRMVPEFQNACFHGKKGDLTVVLSPFGYHLIEIQDQSKASRKTQVGIIERKVEPGPKTTQDIYNSAIDFVTKYHTSETFAKGVEESHLIKRQADPLKENDKSIPGVDNPREIIRWAFNAKKGEVSTDPFRATNKFIVAHVADIREEGVATLEQKKEEVEFGAKKMKKAEKFIEEMNALHASAIDDYASKLNLRVNTADGATFTSYSIPNVGREMDLYGPVFSLKKGEMSKPVAGENGVYVVKIENIKEAPETKDYSLAKSQAKNNYSYRVDIEAIDAIKKKAKIKDNRAKYF
ncbi:MAG TPA: peptidylprolyl isomerase, partial [Bacteroidia bacterium]